MASERQTIVVDFDGTIVEHAYPSIGKLKPGVRDALSLLKAEFHIVICSCRNNMVLNQGSRKPFDEMVAFLKREKIPFDEVDHGDRGKWCGALYIDDRAMSFQNNWKDIAAKLTGG